MKPIKAILVKVDKTEEAAAVAWLERHKRKVTRKAVWELLRGAAYEGLDDFFRGELGRAARRGQ